MLNRATAIGTTWFVYSRWPFAGPEQVLAYLTRYMSMNKRESEIILSTDERRIVLELEGEEKFATKSSGRDEDPVFLEGDKLELAVKSGRWVVTHLPARPRPAVEPVRQLFRYRVADAVTGCDAVTLRCHPLRFRQATAMLTKRSNASEARAESIGVVSGCPSGQSRRSPLSMLAHTLNPSYRRGFPSVYRRWCC